MIALLFAAVILLTSHASFAGQPIMYPAPPAGFDPMSASDDALMTFGYPPRPADNDPQYQAWWQNFVTTPATRQTPQFNSSFHGLTVRHSPMTTVQAAAPNFVSNNWSGYATSRQFPSGVILFSNWVVPSVNLPSVCSGSGAFQSNWKGADGFSNFQVEQGGTMSGIACDGKQYGPQAWYEDYPADAVFYASVVPGDFFSQGLLITGTQMSVYALDYSSGAYYAFQIPLSPAALLQSVESIAEAPEINGAPSVFAPSDIANWVTYGDYTQQPATNTASATREIIDMVTPSTGAVIAKAHAKKDSLLVHELAY